MNIDKVINIFLIVAAIILLVLKITGILAIEWIWFLSPLWIPLCIGILIAIYLGIKFLILSKKEN